MLYVWKDLTLVKGVQAQEERDNLRDARQVSYD